MTKTVDPPKPIRGRKPTKNEIYIKKSLQSIKEWEKEMKGLKVQSKEYKSCRNKIAALQSRLNKREELATLQGKI